MQISIVIPCYGSEATIEGVVKEITEAMEKRNAVYEIILVNDASPDHIWEKIISLCSNHENIHGIHFSKNFGQHSALMAGYRHAKGDVVVSMDDDGQTPADELYKLLDKLEEGYDVVYAAYKRKKHNFFRNLGSKLNEYMCEKLLGKPKGLKATSYFVAKKFVIDEICRYHNPYAYVGGLIFRTTNNVGMVFVSHRARIMGDSGYNLRKLFALWLNGFTAFSIVPLRISSYVGMSSAVLGFIYLIYILIRRLLNPFVQMGWSSITAIMLLLGGMILLVLGMIGEYLGRVYIGLNNAPQYVIKEKTYMEPKDTDFE